MDTNEKNSKQKTAKGGLKAAQKAVIVAEAKMNELKSVAFLAHARLIAVISMQMIGKVEAESLSIFLKSNNEAVLSEDDRVVILGREILADMLITTGAQLEIDMRTRRKEAGLDFYEALDVFERAKEALVLHQTKSNPLPPKQPKRI